MNTNTVHTTYSGGELAQYTGKAEFLAGALFYEIVLIEGHLKGKTKVTQRPPSQELTNEVARIEKLSAQA